MAAFQVCSTCKSRKKKCDKQLPRCSYCQQKDIDCCYDYVVDPHSNHSLQATISHDHKTSSKIPGWDTCPGFKVSSFLEATQIGSIPDRATFDLTISQAVTQIVVASHQEISEIHNRYFNGLHLWVPFLCHERFQKDLVQFHASPTADFAVLLLCMSLLTYEPSQSLGSTFPHFSLYSYAKLMFAQVQVFRLPSIPLIQAGAFIAVYEYAHGRPDDALMTIHICSRMAYKLRIDEKPSGQDWSESWNTWWAIRIYEHVFYCERRFSNIPIITGVLEETDQLPYEVEDLACEQTPRRNCTVAPFNDLNTGCLGRAAQATCLLDGVIRTIQSTVIDDKLSHLIRLDGQLQVLLSMTMNQCHGRRGGHCGAVGISIRALFILHQQIIELNKYSSGSQWSKHSEAAMNTVVQIMVDIARSHRDIQGADVDIISPTCNYLVRYTLEYIYEKRYADRNAWFQDTDDLRYSMTKINHRWPMDTQDSFQN